MAQVVVALGGGGFSERARQLVDGTPLAVIAADSGLDHAVAAGLTPTHLVGDMDSISAAGRMWAYAHEVEIETHPAAKDSTDTELALVRAIVFADERTELVVLGGADPADVRLDHLLGTLLALGHPALRGFGTVRAVLGTTEIAVVHAGRVARPEWEPGRTFSVLALHGACTGVAVRGAVWELVDADLSPTEARGLSNLVKEPLMITVATGTLTVVLP